MSLVLQNVANHGSPYSIQDVFLSFGKGLHDPQNQIPIRLFSEGCAMPGGSINCSLACQQASLVFEDTATLHNCLHYPTIASALAQGTVATESVEVAASYGIYAGDADPSSTIRETIQQCLTEYCDSTPECAASRTSGQDADVPASVCSGQLCYDHTNICEGVYAPVIDDIAGVGVSALPPCM